MRDFRSVRNLSGLLGRLLRDSSGNTLMMIAAALVPLLAMVGGGIDMGRSYLSQTRLQQACDSGVLAARKRLGSQVAANGAIPDDVVTIGNRFFNLNFRDGSYGTSGRTFQMTLESDYSISGAATVNVPTTIMNLFGYTNVAIQVTCAAKLNFSNTDVMFVLDTTGSMADANPGDSESKISALRRVVKSFHTQMEASKSPGTRLRYGFLPYSTNVNVGRMLKSDWMVDSWTYQSRAPKYTGSTNYSFYTVTYTRLSGGETPITPFTSPTCPHDTYYASYGPTVTVSNSPHTYYYDATQSGIDYYCSGSDGNWIVDGKEFTGVIRSTWTYSYQKMIKQYTYEYKPVTYNVTKFKGSSGNDPVRFDKIKVETEAPDYDGKPNYSDAWFTGCIEERATYEIDDYDNVDFSKALDLDIDTVPSPGDPDTQWRPMLRDIVYARSIWWDGNGTFTPNPVTYNGQYLNPAWGGFSACPTEARKLSEMTSDEVSSYVDSLVADGSTYHDIGMIWGARMLSPSGIFADENADIEGRPTNRNLIFLTDGETAPLDLSYGTYGVEPLDRRRWTPASSLSLAETVEKRFGVACEEAKKRNITVWVIGFGVSLNPMMTECAGPGHFYEAADNAELEEVFSDIASQMGDLRVTK